jgi:hypothetical protein
VKLPPKSRFRRCHRPSKTGPFTRPGGVVGGTTGGGLLVQHLPTTPKFHDPNAMFGGRVSLAALGVGILIALFAVGGTKLLIVGVQRGRRGLRVWSRRRRRHRAALSAEARARALMSELCPAGWRAQITLLHPGEELPPDAPEGAQVALDWAELEDEHGRIAVARRVWAPSVAEALDAMVADRQTDETLEQIERGAFTDGAPWSDA